MFEIILILLASLGMNLIITKSWIFLKVRDFFDTWEFTNILFNCPQCMGFWCGLTMSIIFLLSLRYVILISLISSLLGAIYESIDEYLQK